MEHPKHNVFVCVLVCRIRLFWSTRGHKRSEFSSLSSVSLLFFSKNSLFSGCSFSSILVWQILFYLLAHYCVYISSFEKRIRRREEQTRSRDKTHDRRPARLKRNARSVLLCRALLLYLLSVFASRETRKEELKRENCLWKIFPFITLRSSSNSLEKTRTKQKSFFFRLRRIWARYTRV